MGRYFETPFGLIEIETVYLNNEPLARECTPFEHKHLTRT